MLKVLPVPPAGLRQDVQHRLPDPVLSQSAFGVQADVLQAVTDPGALLQQGELPARRLSRLLCEHLQGTADLGAWNWSRLAQQNDSIHGAKCEFPTMKRKENRSVCVVHGGGCVAPERLG